LGKPKELEKNCENEEYFNNTNIDISIPVEETEEYHKANINSNVSGAAYNNFNGK
jgi:hypothetical protein